MISNDFKLLFEAKQKLENEHKKLKTSIEQVKTEYQELYNEYQEVSKENGQKNNHINYYKEHTENLTHQVQELNNKLKEIENERYYYTEPVKKRPKYIARQEAFDDEEETFAEKKPLKKKYKKGWTK